jgi:hypothetical protein
MRERCAASGSLARILLEADREVEHGPLLTAGAVHAEEAVPLELEPVIWLKRKKKFRQRKTNQNISVAFT